MARVHAQVRRLCRCACFGKQAEDFNLAAGGPCAGIALGIKLHPVSTCGFGSNHRCRVGVHEQADTHAVYLDICNQRLEALCVAGESPAVVAGELVFTVGDKGALVQRQAACQQVMHKAHQVLKGIAFDVELAAGPVFHHGGNLEHIITSDVALVGSWVNGDALCARLKAQAGCANHVGNTEVARVAQQRNLVDVDRQRGFVGLSLGSGHSACSSRIICRVLRIFTSQW